MTRKARHVKPQGLVRGLQRGLQVLRVLNEKNYASVLEINRATGLPRTTIYRLLDTLIDAGYVKFGNREEGYCLTVQVRTLSEGYTAEAWLWLSDRRHFTQDRQYRGSRSISKSGPGVD
tara:strand:+ start:393 stop:749 length:357 start_codon:yes stop_codon:yes gene_type:complete